MIKKKLPAKPLSLKTPASQPSLVHRLDALLHTMKCIAQHEDALCELSHEIKRSDVLTPETNDALRGILDKIPARDYVHDLDAVSELLDQPTPVPRGSAKKSSKSAGRKDRQRAE